MKMKVIKKIFSCSVVLGLLTLCLFLSACSTGKSKNEAFKGMTAQMLFERGEMNMARREYKEAVNFFEALDTRYPFSPYSQQAQLDIIYAYYKTGDKASATAAADRYIQLYPASDKVDYAYYMKGVANYEQEHGLLQRYFPVDVAQRDQGTAQESYNDFYTLTTQFPKSPYAADARQRMLHLRELLAHRELDVAKYDYRRGAYIGAVNRTQSIIERFPQTGAVEGALALLYKANMKLGLKKEAEDAKRVLALNYPKSPLLKKLDKD